MRKPRSGQKRPQRYRVTEYHCKACGAYLVLEPDKGYPAEEKEHVLRAYREHGSMRAIERIFGASRNALSRWLEKRDAGSPA